MKKLFGILRANRLLQYRSVLISLFVSFVIAVIQVVKYRYFLFHGTLPRDLSVVGWLKGGARFFALWLSLTLVICFVLRMISAFVHWLLRTVSRVKSGSLPARRILLHAAVIAVVGGLAFLAEFLWGHVITGEPASTGSYFNRYRFLFFLCTAFSIYAVFLFFHKVIRKFEYLFLTVTLIIGFCYSFALPATLISWDDGVHYHRSLRASMFTECRITEADNEIMSNEVPLTYSIAEINQLSDKLDRADNVIISEPRSYRGYFYAYLSYLPSGLALLCGRALHLPFLLTYCLGRFANLITYAFLVFFAIKRLRSGKAILAVIALFPINLFLASNYSYDWFLTAMCMLGFSYLIAQLQTPEESITRKDACIMVFSFFFGIGTKAIYFPLLLLCLLLPREKFPSAKVHRYFLLLVGAATLFTVASFAVPFIASSGASQTDLRGGADVNAAEQIKYVLTHPLTYAQTLFGFLFGDFLSLRQAGGYTGQFAYLGNVHCATPVLMLLTGACLTDRDRIDSRVLTGKFRLVTLLLSAVTIMLFASAMYAAFTPVGSSSIAGCTQRYVEPLLFPIAFCLGSGRLQSEFPVRWKHTILASCSCFILLSSLWQICISSYF